MPFGRSIRVNILGDSRSLERAFARSSRSASQFSKSVSRSTSVTSKAIGGLRSSVLGLGAGFIGAAGITLAVRSAVSEFSDMEQAAAQTAARLQSTAGAANVTAEYVDKLAKSISEYSGEDDEAVQAAENMLLTFTKIGDFAGKNNDIFTQATKVTVDLARAMHIDLSRAALQVGKALNDPARGYARLQRIGVAFDKAQIAAIKNYVKAGRTLDAQRVILAELNKEFGNSARNFGETLPGKIARFRESLLNLSGTIVGELAPDIERLTDRGIAWIQNTQNQQAVVQAFRDVGSAIGTVLTTLDSLADKLGGWRNTLITLGSLWLAWQATAIAATVAVQTANLVAAGVVRTAWQAALISTGFGALAVVAGLAAAYVITHWEKVKLWFQEFWVWLRIGAIRSALAVVEPFSHLPGQFGQWARDAKDAAMAELGELEAQAIAVAQNIGGALAGVGPRGAPGASKLIQKLKNQHKKNTRDLQSLTRRLPTFSGVPEPLSAAEKKRLADAAKRRREEAARKAKEARERAAEARETRQFRLLGFGPGGADLIPGVRALRAQLENVRDKIAGSFLDTKRTRTLISHIRTVLSGQLGKVGEEVRRKIQQILADLNRQLSDAKGATATKFQKISAQAFLASIGITLTPEELRRFRLKFSQLGPGGVLPKPTSQFSQFTGGGVSIGGNVYVYGVENVKGLENDLTKRSNQRAHMRRSTR